MSQTVRVKGRHSLSSVNRGAGLGARAQAGHGAGKSADPAAHGCRLPPLLAQAGGVQAAAAPRGVRDVQLRGQRRCGCHCRCHCCRICWRPLGGPARWGGCQGGDGHERQRQVEETASCISAPSHAHGIPRCSPHGCEALLLVLLVLVLLVLRGCRHGCCHCCVGQHAAAAADACGTACGALGRVGPQSKLHIHLRCEIQGRRDWVRKPICCLCAVPRRQCH